VTPVPVLTAAAGQPWEASLLARSGDARVGVTVVARCLDVVDLLASAQVGSARAAVVAAGLRHLDRDTVARLHSLGLSVVAVHGPGTPTARLLDLGIDAVVPDDATPDDVGRTVVDSLCRAEPVDRPAGTGTGAVGRVVAVWGPAGAPGRSTVALGLADEAAALGVRTLLVDADPYGGTVATQLALLDEAPGITAAVRAAAVGGLDPSELTGLCRSVSSSALAVLTGLPRADRWPELRDAAVAAVLETARQVAALVVVDVGFCVEADEEISHDLPAPRRNGATLTALAAADVVVAVTAPDPLGLQRFLRALPDVRAVMGPEADLAVVVNKLRAGTVAGRRTDGQVGAALERYGGVTPVALLSHDLAGCDRALARGRTLREVAPASPLRAGLQQLVAVVLGTGAADRVAGRWPRRWRMPRAQRGR
jgi:Flp pilus assembly CpaE family ATPase